LAAVRTAEAAMEAGRAAAAWAEWGGAAAGAAPAAEAAMGCLVVGWAMGAVVGVAAAAVAKRREI